MLKFENVLVVNEVLSYEILKHILLHNFSFFKYVVYLLAIEFVFGLQSQILGPKTVDNITLIDNLRYDL